MENKTCPACCEEIARKAIRCSHCGSRQPDAPLMHRGLPGRVAGGVCAALSLQTGWDPVVIRVLFIISMTLSVGFSFWGYAMLWVLTPFEAEGKPPLTRAVEWLKGIFSHVDQVETAPKAQATGPTGF